MGHIYGDIQCDHCGKEICEIKSDNMGERWYEEYCDACRYDHNAMTYRHRREVRDFDKYRHERFNRLYPKEDKE